MEQQEARAAPHRHPSAKPCGSAGAEPTALRPDQHKLSLQMDSAAEPRRLQRCNAGKKRALLYRTTPPAPRTAGQAWPPPSALIAGKGILQSLTRSQWHRRTAPSARRSTVQRCCRRPRSAQSPSTQPTGFQTWGAGSPNAGSGEREPSTWNSEWPRLTPGASSFPRHTASSLRCQTHRATHNFPSDSLEQESLPFPLDLEIMRQEAVMPAITFITADV